MQTYINALILILCYLALVVGEAYHQYLLLDCLDLEEQVVELVDISQVWPENEGKLVYFRGFLRLDDKI
jgi:hypothetical protein